MKRKILITVFTLVLFVFCAMFSSASDVSSDVDTDSSIDMSVDEETVIDNYLSSPEYEAAIQEAIQAGYEDGKLDGASEAEENFYKKGIQDGFAAFRGTKEYSGSLNLRYDQGYIEGYDKGVKAAQEAAFDPGSVLAILFLIILLFALYVIINHKKSKTGAKKK